jgi:hypothetical protein
VRRKPPAPQPLSDVCLNCHAPIETRFCGECGQENEPAAPSFAALIADLWQEFLQLDGKVLKTLCYLIARPGYLSLEYVSGRRIRYVSPFRLYFWATALFVLLFYKLNVIDTEELQRKTAKVEQAVVAAKKQEESELKSDRKTRVKSPKSSPISTPLPKTTSKNENNITINSPADLNSDAIGQIYGIVAPKMANKPINVLGVPIELSSLPTTALDYHSSQDRLPPEKRDSLRERFVKEKVIRARNNPFDFIKSLAGGALPNVLIFCVPIWALMLKVFFRKRLYIEHIIFALHIHIFAIFLFGLQMIAIGGFGWNHPAVRLFPFVALLPYNFLAGKRFYGQHPAWILAKGAGLSLGYGCILGLALVLGILVTLIGSLLNL